MFEEEVIITQIFSNWHTLLERHILDMSQNGRKNYELNCLDVAEVSKQHSSGQD